MIYQAHRTHWILLVLGLAAISIAGAQSMGSQSDSRGRQAESMAASVDIQSMKSHPAAYPRDALQHGVEGEVVVLILVNPQGVAIAAGVEQTSGSAELDQSAVEAVASWSFHPMVLDGIASFDLIRAPVGFHIDNAKAPRPAVPLPEGSDRARWVNQSALAALKHAADAGDRMALEALGNALESGIVLPRDEDRANELFARGRSAAEKAALDGDPKSAIAAAAFYSSGRGTPRDLQQAAKWLRIAAIAGDAWGQKALGRMYMTGEGVPNDLVLAYAWTSVSRREQHGYAEIVDLDTLGASLSVEQLARARMLSSHWKRGEDIK